MPGSKKTFEDRTLTADEQSALVLLLVAQRAAEDDLIKTGLSRQQLKLLGQIHHLRLQIWGVLTIPEEAGGCWLK